MSFKTCPVFDEHMPEGHMPEGCLNDDCKFNNGNRQCMVLNHQYLIDELIKKVGKLTKDLNEHLNQHNGPSFK